MAIDVNHVTYRIFLVVGFSEANIEVSEIIRRFSFCFSYTEEMLFKRPGHVTIFILVSFASLQFVCCMLDPRPVLSANGFEKEVCYGQTYELHCHHTELGPGTGFRSIVSWMKDDLPFLPDENSIDILSSTTTCLRITITNEFQNGSFCCFIISTLGVTYTSRHVAPGVLCKEWLFSIIIYKLTFAILLTA